jgi:hypothetical protein
MQPAPPFGRERTSAQVLFFAAELDKVAQYTSVLADALILVLGVPLLFFLVWRLMQLARMIRLLRLLHYAGGTERKLGRRR